MQPSPWKENGTWIEINKRSYLKAGFRNRAEMAGVWKVGDENHRIPIEYKDGFFWIYGLAYLPEVFGLKPCESSNEN